MSVHRCTALYKSVQHCAGLWNIVQCCQHCRKLQTLYRAVQHCKGMYNIEKSCTTMYKIVQQCTMLYNSIQGFTAVYNFLQQNTSMALSSCFNKKHLGLASAVCLSVWRYSTRKIFCDWLMQYILVIFVMLSLVRIYSGQASGQVLPYKCTLPLYSTVTGSTLVGLVVYKSGPFRTVLVKCWGLANLLGVHEAIVESKPWQDMPWLDTTWHDMAWHDITCHGMASKLVTCQSETWGGAGNIWHLPLPVVWLRSVMYIVFKKIKNLNYAFINFQ